MYSISRPKIYLSFQIKKLTLKVKVWRESIFYKIGFVNSQLVRHTVFCCMKLEVAIKKTRWNQLCSRYFFPLLAACEALLYTLDTKSPISTFYFLFWHFLG